MCQICFEIDTFVINDKKIPMDLYTKLHSLAGTPNKPFNEFDYIEFIKYLSKKRSSDENLKITQLACELYFKGCRK